MSEEGLIYRDIDPDADIFNDKEADLILTMTRRHKEFVVSMAPEAKGRFSA